MEAHPPRPTQPPDPCASEPWVREADRSISNLLVRMSSGMSTGWALILSLLAIPALGLIDHFTGYELSFSIFYLAPVVLATWRAGYRAGVTLSLLCASAWLLVDHTSGHNYTHALIPYWNALVRLGFFTVTVQLLAILRVRLDRERECARMDGLTGVMNSRAFKEKAEILLDLARRHGHSTALAYVDLDNFKTVNDTRGHAEGDRALQLVASTLVTSLRRSDLVARMGGDEFALLLPETPRSGAERVLADLHARLRQHAQDADLPIGFSIGAAIFCSPPAIEEAIHRADHLMYRVKQSGKNRIEIEDCGGAEAADAAAARTKTEPPHA